MFTLPVGQRVLALEIAIPPKELAKIRDNLSAIVMAGEHMWMGGDEGTMLDRVTADGNGSFSRHQRTDLGKFFALAKDASGKATEVDIEGLDVNGGYLWVTGSHSLKRKKPEPDKTADENRKRMEAPVSERNRHTIARVPIDATGNLAAAVGGLTAARLDGDGVDDQLTKALRADRHLGPFCSIPSKENGLDIEGLAVAGSRIFLGLRGPVLRGWAVVLEFELNDSAAGVLAIKGGAVRKHFLQLGGLGVRDLAIEGKDLYILTGPTMDLDGPSYVYRWAKALEVSAEAFVWRDDAALRRVVDVPYGTLGDHAEGMALVAGKGGGLTATICYDSPAAARLDKDHPEKVLLDVFTIR